MRSEGEEMRGEVLPFGDISALVAAAHELKSPLVLMRQLALVSADSNRPESERTSALHQLTMVADRGLRLTADLTRTARLTDSLFAVEPVNVQQLCESIVQQITPLYEQYGRSIRFDVRRARPLALAHRELLSSVIYHFADNALHYGDDGAVTVSLRTRTRQRQLRVGVRDEGPAMSLKEWRTLKGQPSSSMTTRPQASGLGLYIAEQFSQAMGGSIGLTRHRNGATFYIDLPLSEQLSLL